MSIKRKIAVPALLALFCALCIFTALTVVKAEETTNTVADTGYTVTIPAEVNVGSDGTGTLNVAAVVDAYSKVEIGVASANNYSLKNETKTVSYAYDLTGFDDETNKTLTFDNSNPKDGTQLSKTAPLAIQVTGTANISGTYTDTLTFTVGCTTNKPDDVYENSVQVCYENVDGTFSDYKTVKKVWLKENETFTWTTEEIEALLAADYPDTWKKQWQVPTAIDETTSAATNVHQVTIYRKLYYLDVNGKSYETGAITGNIMGYGLVNVWVNNEQVGTSVYDYYHQHRYGSTFRLEIASVKDGYEYVGASMYNIASKQYEITYGKPIEGIVLGYESRTSTVDGTPTTVQITNANLVFKKTDTTGTETTTETELTGDDTTVEPETDDTDAIVPTEDETPDTPADTATETANVPEEVALPEAVTEETEEPQA